MRCGRSVANWLNALDSLWPGREPPCPRSRHLAARRAKRFPVGRLKAFGAGVNEWQACQWLTERGDFDLFLLAGRYTLLEQEALAELMPLCTARDVAVVLGGGFNGGLLATGAVPGARDRFVR